MWRKLIATAIRENCVYECIQLQAYKRARSHSRQLNFDIRNVCVFISDFLCVGDDLTWTNCVNNEFSLWSACGWVRGMFTFIILFIYNLTKWSILYTQPTCQSFAAAHHLSKQRKFFSHAQVQLSRSTRSTAIPIFVDNVSYLIHRLNMNACVLFNIHISIEAKMQF